MSPPVLIDVSLFTQKKFPELASPTIGDDEAPYFLVPASLHTMLMGRDRLATNGFASLILAYQRLQLHPVRRKLVEWNRDKVLAFAEDANTLAVRHILAYQRATERGMIRVYDPRTVRDSPEGRWFERRFLDRSLRFGLHEICRVELGYRFDFHFTDQYFLEVLAGLEVGVQQFGGAHALLASIGRDTMKLLSALTRMPLMDLNCCVTLPSQSCFQRTRRFLEQILPAIDVRKDAGLVRRFVLGWACQTASVPLSQLDLPEGSLVLCGTERTNRRMARRN